MSTEIATVPINAVEARKEDWILTQRQADAFLKSGVFQDVKSLAQAIVKIELGRAMGLSPAEAMANIYFVGGRPCIASEVRAARMKRAGYDWRILRLTDDVCELAIYRGGTEIGRVSYSYDEAQRAGIAGKDNWKKFRSEMLFARAITRAQRRFAPEVLGISIASREEAIDADWSELPEQPPVQAAEAKQEAEALRKRLEAAKAEAAQHAAADGPELPVIDSELPL